MSRESTRHWIASVEEFEESRRVLADVNGTEVAVFEHEGDYHAVANYCVHQAGPLCEGELRSTQKFSQDDDSWEWRTCDDPTVIVCPWHAWRFDITDGRNVDDDRYRVPTYDVEVDDDDVYVLV